MKKLIRLFAIVLVAVFAAGTAAHMAKASAMSADMATSAISTATMADANMGHCDGCPRDDDGKSSSCIDFCLASFAAIPATERVEFLFIAPDLPALPSDEFAGRAVPPDPFPPRSIIL